MAFEGLSEKLNAVFKNLRGKGRVTEEDIRLAMREVRMALLEMPNSFFSGRARWISFQRNLPPVFAFPLR